MKIWIDLCHIPNVPFFVPQIRKLNRLGYETVVTVRNRFQIFELCDQAGLSYYKIGKYYGKRFIMKGIGLLVRTIQLYRFASKQNLSIAISHGSPYQILTAFLLGIPSLTFSDYEHSSYGIFYKMATKIAIPAFIPDEAFRDKGVDLSKLIKYPGLKENVYAEDFEPDPAILDELNIDPHRIIVTLRPPATQAHYHNPQSEQLFSAVMFYLLKKPNVTTVILPRTMKEKKKIQNLYEKDGMIVVPQQAINGLNLIWHSDLVISGGGTMNREAAVLGVPVYSIFRGAIGAVDRFLEKAGRLHFIETVSDIKKIRIEKRKGEDFLLHCKKDLKSFLVEKIVSAASNNSKI